MKGDSLNALLVNLGHVAPSGFLSYEAVMDISPDSDSDISDEGGHSGGYLPVEVNDVQDLDALIRHAVESAVGSESGSSEPSAQLLAANEESIALLAQIAENTDSLVNTNLTFSPTSTQALYFKSVMLNNPWDDYYSYQADTNDYRLYYGKNLHQGSDCHEVRIYRTTTTSTWTIIKNTTTCPSIIYGGYVYTNLDRSCGQFEGVQALKNETLFGVVLLAIFGLSVIQRIFFR